MNCPRKADPFTRGFTVMELLVVVAIVIALASIAFSVTRNMQETTELTRAAQKIKNLGEAFVGYTSDSGGVLPREDATGPDDWLSLIHI